MQSLRIALVGAVAMFAAAPVLAQPAPAVTSQFLTAEQIDPARLLPPPPAERSPVALAELTELHAIESARTAAAFARANSENLTEDATVFAEVLGPAFDLAKLPATSKLMADIKREEKAAAGLAKAHFQRKRPWIVDATFKPCSDDDAPLSSYPSGHTTLGFAMAAVLADIAPSHAAALMARASEYGANRLVCSMHFRADVVAGQVLGVTVARELLATPAFRVERDAAAAELKVAGLAG